MVHASFWLCMFKGSLSTLLSHHIKHCSVHKKIGQLKLDLFVESDYPYLALCLDSKQLNVTKEQK